MASYAALPHQYGAEVTIRDGLAFTQAYGNQADAADRFVIVPPTQATLVEWAKSCLGLGPYAGMHSCGGWSPFRSAKVGVHRGGADGVEHFFYKMGDAGCYDFTSCTQPHHFPLHPWLDTMRAFVRLALLEYVRASEKDRVISPRGAVKKMLYVEWGSAGDEFTLVLCRARIEPNGMIDEMVREAWGAMVRLPAPCTFGFVTQDRVVQNMVIAFAGRAVDKGLRV